MVTANSKAGSSDSGAGGRTVLRAGAPSASGESNRFARSRAQGRGAHRARPHDARAFAIAHRTRSPTPGGAPAVYGRHDRMRTLRAARHDAHTPGEGPRTTIARPARAHRHTSGLRRNGVSPSPSRRGRPDARARAREGHPRAATQEFGGPGRATYARRCRSAENRRRGAAQQQVHPSCLLHRYRRESARGAEREAIEGRLPQMAETAASSPPRGGSCVKYWVDSWRWPGRAGDVGRGASAGIGVRGVGPWRGLSG